MLHEIVNKKYVRSRTILWSQWAGRIRSKQAVAFGEFSLLFMYGEINICSGRWYGSEVE